MDLTREHITMYIIHLCKKSLTYDDINDIFKKYININTNIYESFVHLNTLYNKIVNLYINKTDIDVILNMMGSHIQHNMIPNISNQPINVYEILIDFYTTGNQIANDLLNYSKLSKERTISEEKIKFNKLIMAIKEEDTKTIQELINDNIDINNEDINGNTALMYACQGKNENIIFTLINNGADVNHMNNNMYQYNDNKNIIKYPSESALYYISINRHFNIDTCLQLIRLFIDKKIREDVLNTHYPNRKAAYYYRNGVILTFIHSLFQNTPHVEKLKEITKLLLIAGSDPDLPTLNRARGSSYSGFVCPFSYTGDGRIVSWNTEIINEVYEKFKEIFIEKNKYRYDIMTTGIRDVEKNFPDVLLQMIDDKLTGGDEINIPLWVYRRWELEQ